MRISLILQNIFQWCLSSITNYGDSNAYNFPKNFIIGSNLRNYGQPRINIVPGAKIVTGSDVVLNSEPIGYHAGMSFPVTLIADRPGSKIIIGDGSRLHGCCLHAWSQIIVGRKCLIAAGVQILDSNGHTSELKFARLRTVIQDNPKPIEIGDFCWIGLDSLVLRGARLGEGCIVAAKSVVTDGDYSPFSLLAGSPAEVVRTILPSEVLPENYQVENLADDGKNTFTY